MTNKVDAVVRAGRVVTASGVVEADVAVTDGRITEIGPRLEVEAGEEIDASGLHVFPGGVDAHVHFNEPGRAEWETIACGSAALAAGGYTSYVDMPLNSLPVTIDIDAFDLKLAAASMTAIVDFGIWGGLVPGNVDELDALIEQARSEVAQIRELIDEVLFISELETGRQVVTGFDAVDFYTDPHLVEDPYPYYDSMRAHCPVRREAHHGTYVVTGFEESVAVLSDSTTFSSEMARHSGSQCAS